MAIGSAGAAAAAIEGTGGGFNITPPFSGTLPAALDGGSITTNQDVNISDPYFVTGNSPSLTTTGRIVSSEFVADDGNHAATFTAAGLQDSGTYGFAGNLVLTGNSTTVAAGDTLEAASLTLAPGASLRDDGLIQAGNAPNPFALSVTGNAALSGIGQVNGTLSNASGVVQPGDPGATGTLSVTMNYAQGAGGALAIPVGTSAQSKLQVAGRLRSPATCCSSPRRRPSTASRLGRCSPRWRSERRRRGAPARCSNGARRCTRARASSTRRRATRARSTSSRSACR